MHEVVELDGPEPISSPRKVACFLPLVVQVLQELESESCELFGQRALVKTGDEGLANALNPVEEGPHRGRLVLWKEHGRVGAWRVVERASSDRSESSVDFRA